jgi:hypothetical protein
MPRVALQHAVEDITTIYCNERPRGELLPLTEEQKAKPEVGGWREGHG